MSNQQPKLLPLEDWARNIYGEHAPSKCTLRRWIRGDLILPRPKKHGRAYFCEPTARYVAKESTLVRRLIADVTTSP